MLRPDRHFVNLYNMLLEFVERGLIDLELVKPLFSELGINLRVIRERGTYKLYIRTWTGRESPLDYSPSGARELIPVLLALASYPMPRAVFIEEPEAHLHPRAQRILAGTIAKTINRLKKHVFVTTHSDYLVYALNNLIILSRDLSRARALGYSEDELLKPEDLAVYLVKQVNNRAVLERLEVTPEGF